MPAADSPNSSHEADQQSAAKPKTKLKIVGGVAQANDDHRRGQHLDGDGCRNQPYQRVNLGLAHCTADAVAGRLQRQHLAAAQSARLRAAIIRFPVQNPRHLCLTRSSQKDPARLA